MALAAGTVGAAVYYSMYNVQGGERAIIFNRLTGIRDEVKGEGTHFLIPFLEWPYIFDIRTRPKNVMSMTGTKDLQMVNLNVRVLTKPNETGLKQIYEELGMDFDERVLPSIVNETCKQVVAQFTAVQLLTQREQVRELIKRNLMERAREFNIVMDDVALTDLRFGRDFTAAVEAKQVAQQESERARFVVDKAKQVKLSTVIRAEAEAKSIELIGEAVKSDPGFIQMRKIEAAREISARLQRGGNKLFLNSEGLMLDIAGEVDLESKANGGRK